MARRKTSAQVQVADPAAYSAAPDPPARLTGYAREYWIRIAGLLTAKRVLTPLHLEALETLCDQWDVYVTLKVWLSESADRWVTTTESGYESESVQVRAMGSAHKNLLRLWAQFGLTPHSEARLLPERGPGSRPRDPAAELVGVAATRSDFDEDNKPPK